MKKNLFFIAGFVLFFYFNSLGFGEILTSFDEVLEVNDMALDDQQIYLIENTSVYIYSLKDFKLKKKFGKAGEGPREFMNFAQVTPLENQLLINSQGKVSYFTKDGQFIKELRIGAGVNSMYFTPLKNGFVGLGMIQENQVNYRTINFFESNLKKGKELYRIKYSVQERGGKVRLLRQSLEFHTYDGKLFVVAKKGFIIDVLDHTGKLLFSISQKYEKLKFTPDDEKKVRQSLKAKYSQWYETAHQRLEFPDYFPEIYGFSVQDNKIYVFTYKRKDQDNIEFFIYDMKGKLLKQLFIPMAQQTPLVPYPFAIKGGKLYQVIDNIDNEEWELHVNPIQ